AASEYLPHGGTGAGVGVGVGLRSGAYVILEGIVVSSPVVEAATIERAERLVTTAGGALHSVRPSAEPNVGPGCRLVVNISTTPDVPRTRMTTALITHRSCRLHDMGPHHPECPARLDAIADRLIASGLDGYLKHLDAPAATHKQLELVHAPEYIAAVEAASPEEGICYLDPDTAMNRHTLTAARHAAGAVVLGTDIVLRGECDTAF